MYTVPNNVKDPKLYLSIKRGIDRKLKSTGTRWNAYSSADLVRTYKRRGGAYSGKIKKNSGITRWFKEEWIDVCHYPQKKPCEKSEQLMPYCRPSKRVNKKTPTTASELTTEQRRKRCKAKKKYPKKMVLPKKS